MTNSTNKRTDLYVSRAEAGRIIGISKQSVAYLISRSHFNTLTVAGRVFILRSEAESYSAHSKGGVEKKQSEKKTSTKPPATVLNSESAGRYISQAEAARIRGITQQAIVNLVRRGRLKSTSIAGRTFVLRSEVENFVRKPQLGRPRKKATMNAPMHKGWEK